MHVNRLAVARLALNVRIGMPQVRRRWLVVCIALLTMSWTLTAAAALCHVNGAATGANTGLTWTNAYTDLQSALTSVNCDEIWVAKGIYKPAAASQTVSFNILPNVAVYGGFSGGESSRDARVPATHVTILSGDIDNNDTGTNGVNSDTSQIVGNNSRHIVLMNGSGSTPVTASTVLDGFTLTGGSNNTENGGALRCIGIGAGHECSPTLANLVFSGNKGYLGGAMALDTYDGGIGNPTLTNITFSGNHAIFFGGAMYNNCQLSGSACSPALTNVTFSNNSSANLGGAMFNDGGTGTTTTPMLTNVTFNGNNAVSGGAIYNNVGNSAGSSRLTNVTFYGNSASGNGGAIYTTGNSVSTTSPVLINATFNGNSAANGGAIYNTSANVLLLNSIAWGNSATTSGPEFFTVSGVTQVVDSIIQGGCAANGCSGSPNTGNPNLGALANNGGFTRTLMPGPGSTAINAVACGYSNEMPLTDARGAVRPDSASTGSTRCDIGAVEANSLPGDRIFANRFGSSPWDDF